MSAKDVYCPIPWMFQAVRNNGDVRICCQANVTKNQGVVRKEDGSSYNAGKDDMNEARNAKLMKVVRKNMLEGKWSTDCLLYTSPSPRDSSPSRMPSSA